MVGAILALSVAGFFAPTGVGSFRMFTRPSRYRLDLISEREHEHHVWGATELSPYLGRGARQVLLPMLGGTPGETHGVLAYTRVEALADWLCRADPEARFATARVFVANQSAERREARVKCKR